MWTPTSFGTLLLLCLSGTVLADAETCNPTSLCPESSPCCSQYGQCGVGAFCLGGCDPRSSHSLNSCAPSPSCKSGDFSLHSLDDVTSNALYLGNASTTNWVASGTPVVYQNDSLLLTMAPDTVGTMLSSTHYVWYGRISATLRSSAGAGVVTAFIMMSDVKDEIDFEFVGTDLQHVQSNFYWQGTENYTNSANLSAASTDTQTHTYTFDWTPDSIIWSVDGATMRTVTRASTFNASTGAFQFPQTPARVMLSLWPAGLPSNAPGTIAWAGGDISWASPYMVNGYYYAQLLDVSVECHDPPAGANHTGSESYVYNKYTGLNNTVAVTDKGTVLASFFATGEKPSYDPDGTTSALGTATAPAGSGATQASTVPGGVGGAGQRGGSGDGSSGGGVGTSAGSGSSSSSFIQGVTLGSKITSGAAAARDGCVLLGTVVAVLVALIALTPF